MIDGEVTESENDTSNLPVTPTLPDTYLVSTQAGAKVSNSSVEPQ